MTILTPDFYSYRWRPLARAELVVDGAEVEWPDGTVLRLHHCWLQENAPDRGFDPVTREGLLDPADLLADCPIGSCAVTADGALEIGWTDGSPPARFHPGWLHHIAVGEHRPDAWLPTPEPWTSATFSVPPTHDHATATSSDDGWLAFVGDLLRFGTARLAGVPPDDGSVAAIGARFGPLRDTNFGLVWDVRVDPVPTTTANTARRLGPHTDLPTRETPPGFQLLHCLANTTRGGHSQLTDGLAVARHLRHAEPATYEALTTLRWVFFNRGRGLDHRWSGPVIDLGVAGTPVTFRAFYPVRAFPDMDPADVPRAYAALRRFSILAGHPDYQITFPFEPGHLLAFDNRRVLHGRTRFDAATGHRHLRGCYLDHDDVRSAARVRFRAAADAAVPADTDHQPEPSIEGVEP